MDADECLLLLVRHGQTEWNRAGRVQGHTDSALTDLGRAQARALADGLEAGWLPGKRPSAVYASDLGRAQATARPLAERLGLEIRPAPELREMNFGSLEGLSWDEVEARHPQVSLRLWGDDADPSVRAPDGECRLEMCERSSAALERIAAAHLGETIVAVSHGGVIGFFLRHVLGIAMEPRPTYRVHNGSVAGFRYKKGRFTLWTWGVVPPLTSHADPC